MGVFFYVQNGLHAAHIMFIIVEMALTKDQIIDGLKDLGLKQGDNVVVHSSLSSFGQVENGADTVIDAIVDAVGAEGTVVMPCFNYDPDIFVAGETPSVTGLITETFRKRAGTVRSLHPTHSICASGALSQDITDEHNQTTAFGRGSPLFKLLQASGKVLMLGTKLETCSIVHVAEEIANVSYLDRKRAVRVQTASGKIVTRNVRRPGCSQGFGNLESILAEDEALARRKIGECDARLVDARKIVRAAVDLLKSDPEALLCTRPACDVCAEARAMIAATEALRFDNEVTELANEEEKALRLIQNTLEGGTVDFFDSDDQKFSLN